MLQACTAVRSRLCWHAAKTRFGQTKTSRLGNTPTEPMLDGLRTWVADSLGDVVTRESSLGMVNWL